MMRKSEAIRYINMQLGEVLLKNKETCFSNINSRRPVWWMNIKLEKLKDDFNILLAGENELHWLKIPANSFDPVKDFRIWEEKNAIDLYISSNKSDRYFKDISSGASGIDFKRFIIKSYTIPEKFKQEINKEVNHSKRGKIPLEEAKDEILEGKSEFEEKANIEKSKNNHEKLEEKRIKIHYGDVGYSYESLLGPYLKNVDEITLEDPYIRQPHQISNFVKFCEIVVKLGFTKEIVLITSSDDQNQSEKNKLYFDQLANSLLENNISLIVNFSNTIHDRHIELSTGWRIVLGRGLDYFQSLGGNYFQIGTNDQDLRPCLETNIDFIKIK